MRLVDLSHPVTIHSPGWVGYPGMKMWYFQTHQTNGIVSQMIETPLHLSTHLDSEMHGVSGGRDIASVSLDQCVGPAAIVDISEVGEWGVYTPELVQSKVEVRPRDILILHAGWARYYAGMPEEDLTRYFCKHPGPDHRFAAWTGTHSTCHWRRKAAACGRFCGRGWERGRGVFATSIFRKDLHPRSFVTRTKRSTTSCEGKAGWWMQTPARPTRCTRAR